MMEKGGKNFSFPSVTVCGEKSVLKNRKCRNRVVLHSAETLDGSAVNGGVLRF